MQMMKVFVLMTGLTVLLVVAGDYLGGPDMALWYSWHSNRHECERVLV